MGATLLVDTAGLDGRGLGHFPRSRVRLPARHPFLNYFIMEIIKGIFSENFWWVAPILMTLTVSLTGVINGAFKIVKGMWPQLVSWLVGSLLSVGAWAIKLIEFGDPVWLGVVALCVVVGLSSNGVYDIPTIKAFVDSWFNRGELKK